MKKPYSFSRSAKCQNKIVSLKNSFFIHLVQFNESQSHHYHYHYQHDDQNVNNRIMTLNWKKIFLLNLNSFFGFLFLFNSWYQVELIILHSFHQHEKFQLIHCQTKLVSIVLLIYSFLNVFVIMMIMMMMQYGREFQFVPFTTGTINYLFSIIQLVEQEFIGELTKIIIPSLA